MMYICPECGSDIPEDSGFCYHCGRKRDNTIRLDQSGRFIPPEKDKCASCGADMSPGDLFCPDCGQSISRTQMMVFRPKMVKNGWIGLALAFIPGALGLFPGLFSIYGLGHLYFKKWRKGAVFLLLTAFMYYIKFGGTEFTIWTDLIFAIFSAFIFILQGMEVLVFAFMPPKTAE